MNHLTEPTLLAFLLQVTALIFFIAISFFAYKWVREPVKRNRAKQDLKQLGFTQIWGIESNQRELSEGEQAKDSEERVIVNEYELRDYVWPVFLACLLTFIVYAIAHPYTIQLGLWAGVFADDGGKEYAGYALCLGFAG